MDVRVRGDRSREVSAVDGGEVWGPEEDVGIYDTPILRDSRESRAAPTRGTDSYVTAFARQGVHTPY